MYLSPWRIYTSKLSKLLEDAVENGVIDRKDTVFQGPDGSLVIGSEADDSQYSEYSDAGIVKEYID